MRTTLLDTDILSEIMEGKDQVLVDRARQYYRVFRQFTVSAVTYAEVVAGLSANPKPQSLKSFELIEPMLEVLPFEKEDAETAGRIIGMLKASGQPIGRMDPLIAAIAIEQGLPLATGNSGHYQRVIDLGFALEIENWRGD